MLDLKFFDEYYVGFQNERYNKSDEQGRILGFATHVTNDKAFEKRKETVDHWSDKKIEKLKMKNEPMNGFKIVDAVNRSYNDNKMFRVEDPRGFELEIDVYNLFRIIEEHTIVKGTIVEEMVWARKGQTNYLISKNSPEYQQHKNGSFTNDHIVGKFYLNKVGNVAYRFEGKFHHDLITFTKDRKDLNRTNYHWYNKEPYDASKVSTAVSIEVDNRHKEKMFVYTEFQLKNGEIDTDQLPQLHLKKSKLKDLLETKTELKSDFVFPVGTYIPSYVRTYEDKEAKFTVSSTAGWGSSYYIFFDSLETAKKQSYTIESLEEDLGFKKKLEAADLTAQYDYHRNGNVSYGKLSFRT